MKLSLWLECKIKRLFRHRHKWETTHVNGYQIPTRQICLKCEVSREADSKQSNEPLTYCWVYSDGGISNPLPLGEIGSD